MALGDAHIRLFGESLQAQSLQLSRTDELASARVGHVGEVCKTNLLP
jgi:hypothetical protein